jgi:hypothetical protein
MSTALLTQWGLSMHILSTFVVIYIIYVDCKCHWSWVSCFLLAFSKYHTFKYIFKMFMKISVNLEACCFNRKYLFWTKGWYLYWSGLNTSWLWRISTFAAWPWNLEGESPCFPIRKYAPLINNKTDIDLLNLNVRSVAYFCTSFETFKHALQKKYSRHVCSLCLICVNLHVTAEIGAFAVEYGPDMPLKVILKHRVVTIYLYAIVKKFINFEPYLGHRTAPNKNLHVRGVIQNFIGFLRCVKYIWDIDLKNLHCLEELK